MLRSYGFRRLDPFYPFQLQFFHEMTGRTTPLPDVTKRRFLSLAPVLTVSTAGVEVTAAWRVGIIGHTARQADNAS